MWRENLQKITDLYKKAKNCEYIANQLQKSVDEVDDFKSQLLFMEKYDQMVREGVLTAADMIVFSVIVGDLIQHMSIEERTKFDNALDHQREVYRLRN